MQADVRAWEPQKLGGTPATDNRVVPRQTSAGVHFGLIWEPKGSGLQFIKEVHFV